METLTLTVPETTPAITGWRVQQFYVDVAGPSIKVTLVSTTDPTKTYPYRYVVSDTVTAAQVMTAITFINAGTFKTQGKTLQQWLLEQIAAQIPDKAGTVTP